MRFPLSGCDPIDWGRDSPADPVQVGRPPNRVRIVELAEQAAMDAMDEQRVAIASISCTRRHYAGRGVDISWKVRCDSMNPPASLFSSSAVPCSSAHEAPDALRRDERMEIAIARRNGSPTCSVLASSIHVEVARGVHRHIQRGRRRKLSTPWRQRAGPLRYSDCVHFPHV